MDEDISKFRSPDGSTDSDVSKNYRRRCLYLLQVEDSEDKMSKMKLGNRTARAATRVN